MLPPSRQAVVLRYDIGLWKKRARDAFSYNVTIKITTLYAGNELTALVFSIMTLYGKGCGLCSLRGHNVFQFRALEFWLEFISQLTLTTGS